MIERLRPWVSCCGFLGSERGETKSEWTREQRGRDAKTREQSVRREWEILGFFFKDHFYFKIFTWISAWIVLAVSADTIRFDLNWHESAWFSANRCISGNQKKKKKIPTRHQCVGSGVAHRTPHWTRVRHPCSRVSAF